MSWPRVDQDKLQDNVIYTRVDAETHKAIAEEAARSGKTMSALVREVLREKILRKKKESKKKPA